MLKERLASLFLIILLLPSGKVISALPDIDGVTPPGVLSDPHCNLSVGASVIDYGQQSRGQLQENAGSQAVSLGKRTLMLSVVCPFSQTLRMALRGDGQSSNGSLRFGSHGHLTVRLLEAQLDGQSVQVVTTTPDGIITSAPEQSLLLQQGSNFAAVRNGQLASGKSFNARVEIEPMLPEHAIRVATRESNEARLILELLY